MSDLSFEITIFQQFLTHVRTSRFEGSKKGRQMTKKKWRIRYRLRMQWRRRRCVTSPRFFFRLPICISLAFINYLFRVAFSPYAMKGFRLLFGVENYHDHR